MFQTYNFTSRLVGMILNIPFIVSRNMFLFINTGKMNIYCKVIESREMRQHLIRLSRYEEENEKCVTWSTTVLG